MKVRNSLKLIYTCLISVFLFSSCGLLLKERTVRHNGIERNDFDLPLIIYRSSNPLSSKLVVLLSGDGGWLEFNNQLAVRFAKKGYHTIGFNSRTYFWHQKTPEQTTDDFVRLLRKYSNQWRIKQIILCGYSFGADVVPFLYNRLPEDLKTKVTTLQMLSPFLSTDFKVYIKDLINSGEDDRTYKVKDEVAKVTIPIYCFYGKDEEPKPLGDVIKKNFHIRLLAGDHEYSDGYSQIVSAISR
jgi:type IV secretory pathway VirJ component